MPALYSLIGGWVAILLGCLAGATQGLFFHKDDWLGGYGSWPRRMTRLGHVALVALGLLNVALAGPAAMVGVRWEKLSGALLFAAMCTMPAVCDLSALRRGFRHLFYLPALCVIAGVCSVIWGVPWTLD